MSNYLQKLEVTFSIVLYTFAHTFSAS